MTRSPMIFVWQESGARRQGRAPVVAFLDLGEFRHMRAARGDAMLANSPSPTFTWQRPQMARPPQTESMSTPSARAACNTGVPTAKRPRLPEGVKTMRDWRRSCQKWLRVANSEWRMERTEMKRSVEVLAHPSPFAIRHSHLLPSPPCFAVPCAGPRCPRSRTPRPRPACGGGTRGHLAELLRPELAVAVVPFSTLAPKMACMSSSCSGFMMAEVMPWLAAMARK